MNMSFSELMYYNRPSMPSSVELAAADYSGCLYRGTERFSKDSEGKPIQKTTVARCSRLTDVTGWTIDVGRGVCKKCICSGPCNGPELNPYLQYEIRCGAWCHLVPSPQMEEAVPATDAEVEKAVANMKLFYSADGAARFVDALVYHESITPEKGADLYNTHSLPDKE